MDKYDRADLVIAAFAAKFPDDFDRRMSYLFYAAGNFTGYQGSSSLEAALALAEKYTDEAKIADLPRMACFARS